MSNYGWKNSILKIYMKEWLLLLYFAAINGAMAASNLSSKELKLKNNQTSEESPPLVFPQVNADQQAKEIVDSLMSPNKVDHPRIAPIIVPNNIPRKILTETTQSSSVVSSNVSINIPLVTPSIAPQLNISSTTHSSSLDNTTECSPENNSEGSGCHTTSTSSTHSVPLSTTETTTVKVKEDIKNGDNESSPPELSPAVKNTLKEEENKLIYEPAKSAAGFVVAAVVVSVMAYVGLFVWRRLLEQRYGNREMLIDEDQFCHASNLYDFNISREGEA